MNWKQQAEDLRFNKNLSWSNITEKLQSEFPNLTYQQVCDKVRTHIRKTKKYKEQNKSELSELDSKKSFEMKSDGTFVSDRLIGICENEDMTPEFILKAHNLDTDKWEVVSYKNNLWHSQVKGGKQLVMYQSKVVVRPKAKTQITLEDIDDYFKTKKYSDIIPNKPKFKVKDGQTLEILLPDLHIGLYSNEEETNEKSNLETIKIRFFNCLVDIVENCRHINIKNVLLVTLGDVLHVDNDNQTTTKGTLQQVSGRISEIIECAEDMLIGAIEYIKEELKVSVEVIYLSGNHDRTTGYMLSRSVYYAFKQDLNVTVDTSPNPHKHRVVGTNLIGYTHGELPKKTQQIMS